MFNRSNPVKAQEALTRLDDALCQGQVEVQELMRKVNKHACHRQTFVLVAQIYCEYIHNNSLPQELRSTHAWISGKIQPLVEAIRNVKEKEIEEDVFNAQVCLASVYARIGYPSRALAALTGDFNRAFHRLKITLQWTHVSVVKGSLIRGMSLEKEDRILDAIRSYQSLLGYLHSPPKPCLESVVFRASMENLAGHYCKLLSSYVTAQGDNLPKMLNGSTTEPAIKVLPAFEVFELLWKMGAKFCPKSKKVQVYLPTFQAWYRVLSTFLQHGLLEPTFQSKAEFVCQIRQVEYVYGEYLMGETCFPTANEINVEIQIWVEQVMANWRILNGRAWYEDDLGKGARITLGKHVLRILHRAAEKTFHSPKIMRHLFTVFVALADFDVARRALETYVGIVDKAKARNEKSEGVDISLDDDATILSTTAAGIKMLCSYGQRAEAEKSMEIAKILEVWLTKMHPDSLSKPKFSANVYVPPRDQSKAIKPTVPSGKALATGIHALGVNKARWARLTHEPLERRELQENAIDHFLKALDPDFGEELNPEFSFSLGLVLAETQELDSAIKFVNRALLTRTPPPNTDKFFNPNTVSQVQGTDVDISRRELFFRCWHLQALLLTARGRFDLALHACDAAFDLYGDKSILRGETQALDSVIGTVFSERKSMIELKMTQLAILEVNNSPREAVDASQELFHLFTRLFAYVEKPGAKAGPPSTPPKPLPTTSFRIKDRSVQIPVQRPAVMRAMHLRKPAVAESSKSKSPHLSSIIEDHHQEGSSHAQLVKNWDLDSISSYRKRQNHDCTLLDESYRLDTPPEPDAKIGIALSNYVSSRPTTPITASSPSNPLRNIPSATENMNRRNPNTHPVPPTPNLSQPNRHPNLAREVISPGLPSIHYPPEQWERLSTCLLLRIWCFIADLYLKAGRPHDAEFANNEAMYHLNVIKAIIINEDGGSSVNFATPRFGDSRSCDTLNAEISVVLGAISQQHYKNPGHARVLYEAALVQDPRHLRAIVGLSNLLLDYSVAPIVEPQPYTPFPVPRSVPTLATLPSAEDDQSNDPLNATPPPGNLMDRIAARDRAYGLLSAVTKTGAGWDDPDAWLALAVAHLNIGEHEKAMQALKWVEDLGNKKGVRAWDSVDHL